MFNEEDKREILQNLYDENAHSEYDMCCHDLRRMSFLREAKYFIYFLPNLNTVEIPDISYIKDKEDRAVAFVLTDKRIKKWMKADLARIFSVSWAITPTMRINCYYNVHIARRKRWGMFK